MFRLSLSWMLLSVTGFVLSVTGVVSNVFAARKPIEHREKYLLLEDRVVETAENAQLTLGVVKKHPDNPLWGAELPWETQLCHMYLNVIFDKEENIYKCWYFTRRGSWQRDITLGSLATGETEKEEDCPRCFEAVLYAVSQDGIKWDKPKLDVYRYKGKPTNIVFYSSTGTGVFKDLREPDPQRRYKLITGSVPHDKVYVAFSPDGIRWSKRQLAGHVRGDTHNNALWAPSLGKYVAITREYPVPPACDKTTSQLGIRTVLRMESDDFVHWTEPTEVLRNPTRDAQVYSMPVFWYESVYLGLPAIYRVDTDKRVHTELAWSSDTVTWNRIIPGNQLIQHSTQLIPLAKDTASIEWGCIYAAASPVVLENEIRIYYSAQKKVHSWQDGWLCMATMRPDGWAGYEPFDPGQPASVHTSAVTCLGTALRVTADAKGGELTVTIIGSGGKVLATSNPITDDVTSGEVQWRGGFDWASLGGKPICLRFGLKRAKVFSFDLVKK